MDERLSPKPAEVPPEKERRKLYDGFLSKASEAQTAWDDMASNQRELYGEIYAEWQAAFNKLNKMFDNPSSLFSELSAECRIFMTSSNSFLLMVGKNLNEKIQ